MRDASFFSLPEVQNWILNIENGLDEYFWDDNIYYFTKIVDSFEPFMRVCVEWRIEGKKPSEIAELSGKDVNNVYQTLKRAKKRLTKAVFSQIGTQGEERR